MLIDIIYIYSIRAVEALTCVLRPSLTVDLSSFAQVRLGRGRRTGAFQARPPTHIASAPAASLLLLMPAQADADARARCL